MIRASVWQFIRPAFSNFKGVIAFTLFLFIIIAGTQVAEPVIYGRMIDTITASLITHDNIVSAILGLLLIWIGLFVVSTSVSTLATYLVWKTGNHLVDNFAFSIFSEMLKWSQRKFSDLPSGKALRMFDQGWNGLWRVFVGTMLDIGLPIITFIFVLAVGLTLDWRMTVLTLLTVPPSAILGWYSWKRAEPKQQKVSKNYEKLFRNIGETFSNISVVQNFAQETRQSATLLSALKRTTENQLRMNVFWSISNGLGGGFQLLSRIIIFAAGVLFVANGSLTLGSLIAFLGLLNYLLAPIQHIFGYSLPQIEEALIGLKRLQRLVSEPKEIVDSENAVKLKVAKGNIIFKDVSVSYRRRKVLANINLKISGGSVCAIVGASGAGKSTLAKLVNRTLDAREGHILIDGQDVRNVSLNSLRSNIGIVSQETNLFHDSILNNVRFARPNASEKEVIEACKNAEAHEFIQKLPEKYRSTVGERGVKLSGGERQRLALARIFLANPPILILDESTSALDSETEYKLQQTLKEVMKGRTSIVIAHRLSTVYLANQIVVLKDGKIEDIGTHNELIERGGLYDRLWSLQAGGFLD